jgi:hypothetical protein
MGMSMKRWLNWEPDPQILEGGATAEPSKPSKPGFAGFDGSILGAPSRIEGVASEAQAPVDFTGTVEEFQKFFTITGVRMVGPKDRGTSMEQWGIREITNQSDEYLRSLPTRPVLTSKSATGQIAGTAKPAKPLFGCPRVKVTQRTTGQTVAFGPYEWIHNPRGITFATMRQIEELSAKGERPIQVLQWPAGEVVLTDGQWKGGASYD